MIYKLSDHTKNRQLFIIVLFLFLDLIFLFFYIEDILNLYFLSSIFIIQVYINIVNYFLYDIIIIDKMIILENLYRKINISGSEFDRVEKMSFIYLLGMMFSPPFFVLKLKNGEKYIFLSNSLKSYFSLFTLGFYNPINKINEDIANILSE